MFDVLEQLNADKAHLELEIRGLISKLYTTSNKLKSINRQIAEVHNCRQNKSHRCMCCGKTVEHINVYGAPPPHAKHHAEWRGIEIVELCDACNDNWNKKLIPAMRDKDARITAANKWLFDRICKNTKAK